MPKPLPYLITGSNSKTERNELLKRFGFALLGLVLILTLALPLTAPVHAQTNDAGTLVKSFIAAFNKGDAATAAGLFASDAVVNGGNDATDTYQGIQNIQGWIQGGIKSGVQVQLVGEPQVAGSKATGTDHETVPDLTKAGIDYLEQTYELTADGGKIKNLTLAFTPAAQAKLAKLGPPPSASGQGGSSSAAPGVPSTGAGATANAAGDSSSNFNLILIGVGSLLVVACVAFVSFMRLRKPTKR